MTTDCMTITVGQFRRLERLMDAERNLSRTAILLDAARQARDAILARCPGHGGLHGCALSPAEARALEALSLALR